ncbi:uncharacterized protein LOC122798678 [Protopterus annectens]|uniref:uncharacterized protein LOC122798678 n=1 Tax=Protopterus annectens TaxID=7888 RepID=UPI001CF9E807|nr:uncharacterized protein LOC122798678 [Protopterus annectens]
MEGYLVLFLMAIYGLAYGAKSLGVIQQDVGKVGTLGDLSRESGADDVRALRDLIEQYSSLKADGNKDFPLFHSNKKRGVPGIKRRSRRSPRGKQTNRKKNPLHRISNSNTAGQSSSGSSYSYRTQLLSWKTNHANDTVVVPKDTFKDHNAAEYFKILSHFLEAFPLRYVVKFPLAGEEREVQLGSASRGKGQIVVYGKSGRAATYNAIIRGLTSSSAVNERVIADKLLGSLVTKLKDVDNNIWSDFTEQQKEAAVELIAVTHIAEAVPANPAIPVKPRQAPPGRTPAMAEYARVCLGEIAKGRLTFKSVFANGTNSLYPAAGPGGTDRARRLAKITSIHVSDLERL